MGWGISLPKIKVPKITVKAPKIKMDPAKLVTKSVEGVTNLNSQIMKSQIGAVSDLAGSAVGAVGQVMSQPGAGALLGAAGAAFGVPGAGLLASSFMGKTPEAPQYSAETPAQGFSLVDSPRAAGDNKNLYIGIAAGVGALVLILVITLKKKKR